MERALASGNILLVENDEFVLLEALLYGAILRFLCKRRCAEHQTAKCHCRCNFLHLHHNPTPKQK